MRNGNNALAVRQFPVPLPSRMATLPVDQRGFPVPVFVAWFDGEPDFRVVDPKHMQRCLTYRRCWICGEPLGARMAFVIGPMCCINRISSEPPSHLECAEFAAQCCPFLSQPLAKRPDMERRPPPGPTQPPAGEMLAHNPGASAVWVTKSYQPFRVDNGVLFRIGEPTQLTFWTKGRKASRDEVDAAVAKGLPFLAKMAAKESREAERALENELAAFQMLLAKVLPENLPDIDNSSFFEAAR